MNTTPTGWKVQAPSVTLFAFHLRNDITKGNERVVDKADDLWEQCVALGEQRNILILKCLKTKHRSYTYNNEDCQYNYTPAKEDKEATEAEKPYLYDWLELVRKDPSSDKARQLCFHSNSEENGLFVSGEIYPLRIHDTYAVDLTLRYREIVDIAQLSQLNPTDKIQASIGQTLLLFAKPFNVPESAYQDFANQCVAALLHQTAQYLKPRASGQLFGSPIFEYDNDNSDPRERCHILVWLNCHEKTLSCIGQTEAYHALLNLLCCRSKILYAYHQSRQCDRNAQQIYTELEEQINTLATSLQQELETLKQWLKQTPLKMLKYNKWLRDIQDHQNTIVINTENYRSRLEKITASSLEKDDCSFLHNFINLSCKQFQEQISIDLRYLTPAQGLFQQMIDTVQGIVQIEAEEQAQAREQYDKERDRNLQINIAAVGVGIGAAGVIGSSFQYLIKPEPENYKILLQPPFISSSIHPFTLVVLTSLVLGLIGAGITKVLTMLIPPRRNKRAKLKGSNTNKLLKPATTPVIKQVTEAQSKKGDVTFSQ
ncbi:MAG: hypothetical protein KME57_21150 [Scytonema hyalinum WJT4-NPBG1]|jgi:hypothetical protein|nr:hypothetical protein [Scytonema hyalinum WJT4-NPBG1]